MKKSTSFLMGMAALLLAFGFILAGCKTDADDDNGSSGGGITLEGLAGEYSFDDIYHTTHTLIVTVTGSTLTFKTDNKTIATTDKTISGVTIATGGIGDRHQGLAHIPSTWVYLVNSDGKKIGVANKYEDGTDIYLGESSVAEFARRWQAETEEITDDSIICEAEIKKEE